MSDPVFQRHAHFFNDRNGVAMVEIWTVIRHPGLGPENERISVEVITRTAADQAKLEALGEKWFGAAFAGNVILPEDVPAGVTVQFGALNRALAIDHLIEGHPNDAAAKRAAQILVDSV